MKKTLKHNYIFNCIILLLPIISYCWLGPLEIYGGNTKDFLFSFQDFFWYYLLIGFGVMVSFAFFISLIPDIAQRILQDLIFVFGVLSYLQYMFFNTKLSEDNGSPMDWATMKKTTMINSVLWLVLAILLIVVIVCLKKYRTNIIKYGSLFLSCIQLVAIVTLMVTLVGKEPSGNLQMVGNDQYKVATDENIIVFVVDTMGSTQLSNALEQYPGLLDGLEDFTYYDNSDCHYYCTFPSMTHMLTGNEFDFDSESYTWLDTSWATDKAKSFYDNLHNRDYKCYLYSPDVKYVYGSCENLYGKFDNIQSAKTNIHTKMLLKRMTKMSIYRYVPYILKPRFEVLTQQFSDIVSIEDGVNVVDDNNEYVAGLREYGLSFMNCKKAFVVEHIFGTHKPYTIDENGNSVEEAEELQTVAGCMVVFKEYINQLKVLGVYDKSTIILTSDHGSWYGSDGQPIFFVKAAGETNTSMIINSAPISHDDFQATIMELIGIEDEQFGKSIWDWNESEKRERSVYMRISDENYPDVEGSSFNTYYGYTYTGNKGDLIKTVDDGPDEILMATPWK